LRSSELCSILLLFRFTRFLFSGHAAGAAKEASLGEDRGAVVLLDTRTSHAQQKLGFAFLTGAALLAGAAA
jgi:hypothetical protein